MSTQIKTLILAVMGLILALPASALASPKIGERGSCFYRNRHRRQYFHPSKPKRQNCCAGMDQPRLPVCKKALWHGQHAGHSEGRHRSGHHLGIDRFFGSRQSGSCHPRRSQKDHRRDRCKRHYPHSRSDR